MTTTFLINFLLIDMAEQRGNFEMSFLDAILGIVGLMLTASVAWTGQSIVTLKGEVAVLNATLISVQETRSEFKIVIEKLDTRLQSMQMELSKLQIERAQNATRN